MGLTTTNLETGGKLQPRQAALRSRILQVRKSARALQNAIDAYFGGGETPALFETILNVWDDNVGLFALRAEKAFGTYDADNPFSDSGDSGMNAMAETDAEHAANTNAPFRKKKKNPAAAPNGKPDAESDDTGDENEEENETESNDDPEEERDVFDDDSDESADASDSDDENDTALARAPKKKIKPNPHNARNSADDDEDEDEESDSDDDHEYNDDFAAVSPRPAQPTLKKPHALASRQDTAEDEIGIENVGKPNKPKPKFKVPPPNPNTPQVAPTKKKKSAPKFAPSGDLTEDAAEDRVARKYLDIEYAIKGAIPERRITYGIVYPANKVDLQGEWADRALVEKAAHRYLQLYRYADTEHNWQDVGGAVVESYLAPCDIYQFFGKRLEQPIREGTWILAYQWNEPEWNAIKSGKIQGYSLGGLKRVRAGIAPDGWA